MQNFKQNILQSTAQKMIGPFKMILVIASAMASQSLYAFTLSSDYAGWDTNELEILVNTQGCTTDILPAVQQAIDLWNSVPFSGLELSYTESTSITVDTLVANSHIGVAGIACDTTPSSPLSSTVPGYGAYRVSTTGQRVGFVVLNAGSGQGGIASYSSTLLAVILAHEIGHMLNIGHSKDTSALMYYNASYKKELNLSSDDVSAYTYLYPRNEFFDDGLLGCAMIRKLDPPNSNMLWLFLFLPLLFLMFLRFIFYRNKYAKLKEI